MNMHRALLPITAISCILASTPVFGAQRGTVDLQLVQPAKFTDFDVYGRGSQWSASYFATQISDALSPAVERKVSGGRLTLKLTDIDLAGHYRSAGRGAGSVRVTTGERHPSRMSFAFVLQDSSGRTLASGMTRLVDTSSLTSMTHNPNRRQPLYYEKRMLDRWLRSLKVS
jgi:hypothetical protein